MAIPRRTRRLPRLACRRAHAVKRSLGHALQERETGSAPLVNMVTRRILGTGFTVSGFTELRE